MDTVLFSMLEVHTSSHAKFQLSSSTSQGCSGDHFFIMGIIMGTVMAPLDMTVIN